MSDLAQAFAERRESTTVLFHGPRGGGKSQLLLSILPILLNDLSRQCRGSILSLSAVELYSGELRDILAVDPWDPLELHASGQWPPAPTLPSMRAPAASASWGPVGGSSDATVPSLVQVEVPETVEDVQDLVDHIVARRTIRQRDNNAFSSSGHVIIRINARYGTSEPHASFVLVDGIGTVPLPQNPASQTQTAEALSLNRGSDALAAVLSRMWKAGGGRLVFRQHRLTRLLQGRLESASTVLIIGAVSPCVLQEAETRHALAFLQKLMDENHQVVRKPRKKKAKPVVRVEAAVRSPERRVPVVEADDEEDDDVALGSEWLSHRRQRETEAALGAKETEIGRGLDEVDLVT